MTSKITSKLKLLGLTTFVWCVLANLVFGVNLLNPPSGVSGDGGVRAFVVGDDNQLYVNWETTWGGPAQWAVLGGGDVGLQPNPAALDINNVFVVGVDGQLYRKYWDYYCGCWAWQAHGTPGLALLPISAAELENRILVQSQRYVRLWCTAFADYFSDRAGPNLRQADFGAIRGIDARGAV